MLGVQNLAKIRINLYVIKFNHNLDFEKKIRVSERGLLDRHTHQFSIKLVDS